MATARRWRRPERFYDRLAPLARLVVWLLADLRGRYRRMAVGSGGGLGMGADTTRLEDEEIRTVWPGTRAQGGATVSDGDSGGDADSSDSDGDSGDDSDSFDSGSDSDSDTSDSGDDSYSSDR